MSIRKKAPADGGIADGRATRRRVFCERRKIRFLELFDYLARLDLVFRA